MANELRHADVGTALSKAEWEGVSAHIFNSQAAGDIPYASSTSQLSRLGIGSAKQILSVNSAGTAPEWVSSPAVVTALVPDAADGATIGTAALEFSDVYLADAAVIYFGADQEVTLTHVHNTGLLLNSTMAIQFNDASQYINAPTNAILDINATDEIELNATLADVNANLDVSGTYTGGGLMTTGGNIVIPDAGNIGSASDTDAIAISSGGVVTMNQIPVFSAGINVSGGTIAGTLATAAQGSVTSLGTLTALTVDDVAIDGKVVTMTGSASDTAVFTAGTNGTLSIVTTDAAAAAANIQITADGTVDIDSAGVLTLDSGAAINIEPASGSAILLDGTISIDAGVVTGATSITSTTFVGNIDAVDGDFDGTLEADAYTVDGTTLAEYIADTVGAMIGGNTETRIAVTYDDSDNTLDFVVDDMTASGSTTFVLEDDDGTEVTIANSKEVKFIGSGVTTNWTDTDNGTDADPYDLTFTVDAAQTGITSVLNASLVVGRDADNDIDFTTDNNIRFRAGAEDQLTLTDGYLTPSSNAIVDLGTDALEFNNAFFDGTVAADAITIGGTNIVSGSLITTLGTVSAGTWQGTAIASAYLDSDTAHLSGTQTFSGAKTFSSTVTGGSDGSGVDVVLYSGTAGDNLTWDASEEVLQITGTNGATSLDVLDGDVRVVDTLYFYDRGGEYLSSDGSTLSITGTTTINGATTINQHLTVGATTTGNNRYATFLTDDGYASGIVMGNNADADRAWIKYYGADDTPADILEIKTTGSAHSRFQVASNVSKIDFQGSSGAELITTAGDLTLSPAGGVDLGANTLTSTGSMQIRTIDYSDGDLAMTIADGGGVTFAQDITMTADKSLNLPQGANVKFTDAITQDSIDDHDAQGIIMTFQAGMTVTPFSPVYLGTDDEVHECDADAIATMPAIGVSINTSNVTDGNSIEVMLLGLIRDESFTDFGTNGAPVFVSTTVGTMSNTAPSGDDDVVQIIGHSVGEKLLFVQPSLTYLVVDA